AVKFTAKGEVRLSVRPARSETGLRSELPVWEFVVSDTGCGIAEGELERLFRPFEQADASTTRAYGGTGLGLALSRRLAERLGGELTAESTLGEGSRFTLRLPAATATPPLDEEEPAGAVSAGPGEGQQDDEPLLGLRVLLAEDTEDNRRLLSFYLRRSGAEVETVENGRQAVDRLMGTDDEPPPDPPFDVVLMDMQMPVLDGYDAARELRARRYEGPIIALTAHAMAGDADVSDAAGCDGYAVKPISRDTLAATVLKAARRRLEAGSTV
ncbi:MAG: response regulator, partial [Planctomycetota bacterium]